MSHESSHITYVHTCDKHICVMTPQSRALSLACTCTCVCALSVPFLNPSPLSLSSLISLSHISYVTLTSHSHDSLVPPHTSLPHTSFTSLSHTRPSHPTHLSRLSLKTHTFLTHTQLSHTHTSYTNILSHTHISLKTHTTLSLSHTHISTRISL